MQLLKADMHVHSKYSSKPSQWILKKLGCPESFTEPQYIYEKARAEGMDFVTITDHNVIDGALEIAHLDGTFLSEEVTAYFPNDRCKVHVLVYDITEDQHQEIQRLRENIFDLSLYLRREDLVHAVAHPLFAVNDRLTVEHFEKCLLLFDIFEANGCRDAMQNTVLSAILSALTPNVVQSLEERHGFSARGVTPWVKGMIGGSDDHSGLNISSMHTVAPGLGVGGFLRSVAHVRSTPQGRAATGHALARNLYAIAYQFYRSRSNTGRQKMLCLQFADQMLGGSAGLEDGLFARLQAAIGKKKSSTYLRLSDADGVKTMLLKEATRLIEADPEFSALARGESGDFDQQWFRFVSQASDKLFATFLDRLLTSAVGADIFDVFSTIGTAGSLYALLAPYFVSFGLFARERGFSRKCSKRFDLQEQETFRVLHFTDTFEDVNGVSWTIRQQLDMAQSQGKQMTVVTCGTSSDAAGLMSFEPIGTFEMPEYPELKLSYPPFLRMLEYSLQMDSELILAATPGPVGLAALGISRILQIPIHGTYHTAFPQYVGSLTNDAGLEEMTRKYMAWFYKQMDIVYAPSQAIADELVLMGVDRRALRVYPRGVDTVRFDPVKRNGFYKQWDQEAKVKLIYVGRISKEKDLDILTESFREVCKTRQDICLVMVGDGPYRAEMESRLSGMPVLFTGMLHGDALAQAYASADLFVFPSTTDTFGNVVLEAQASGLPVIVSDKGGPKENIDVGVTGFVVAGRDVLALAKTIDELCFDPERLRQMGNLARQFAEKRDFGTTFLETWQLFKDATLSAA